MERRSMKVLCRQLRIYVELKEVLTSMSTEAVCPNCTLHYLPESIQSHCDNIGWVVANIHKRLIPESYRRHLTASHASLYICAHIPTIIVATYISVPSMVRRGPSIRKLQHETLS